MNFADPNEHEISQATRERIDEFSRELALALKRIVEQSKESEGMRLPEEIKANPIPKKEEKSTT